MLVSYLHAVFFLCAELRAVGCFHANLNTEVIFSVLQITLGWLYIQKLETHRPDLTKKGLGISDNICNFEINTYTMYRHASNCVSISGIRQRYRS